MTNKTKTINTLIKDGKYKFISEPKQIFSQDFGTEYSVPLKATSTQCVRDKEHQATIESVCDGLKEFLLAKNKNYGNSATEPVRIFSKCNAQEGILVRMDDKLSRTKNAKEVRRNDMCDLAGYLILLMKNNGWDNFIDMVD